MKNIHTDRIHITVSPVLKKSIQTASHAKELSISEYVRSLIYEDLLKNMDEKDGKFIYAAEHEIK